MKKALRVFSTILAILFIFSTAPFISSASAVRIERDYFDNQYAPTSVCNTAEEFWSLFESMLRAHESRIELSVPSNIDEITKNRPRDVYDTFFFEFDNGSLKWQVISYAECVAIRGYEYTTYVFDRITYRNTLEEIERAHAIAKHIVEDLRLEQINSFDKMDKIAAYVRNNWSYDFTLGNETALSVFETGNGTCLGLTMAVQLLLDEAGIESRTIQGTFKNDLYVTHIWLIVNLNGYWYSIEPTAMKAPGLYLANNFDNYSLRSEYQSEAFTSMYPLSPVSYTQANVLPNEIAKLFRDGVLPVEFAKDMDAITTRSDAIAILVNMAEAFKQSSLENNGSPFTDIAGSAFESQIEKAYTAAFIKGTSLETFSPSNTVTREQFAVMAANVYSALTDTEIVGNTAYSDVSSYARAAVSVALRLGWMKAEGNDGIFAASMTMTREEVATTVVAILKTLSV